MPESQRQKTPDQPGGSETPPGPHHIADEPLAETDAAEGTVQSPVTETGLSVEEQVRKEWDPKKQGGLPTPLADGAIGPR